MTMAKRLKAPANLSAWMRQIGSKGGRTMSDKKREHLQRISTLPRPGRKTKEVGTLAVRP